MPEPHPAPDRAPPRILVFVHGWRPEAAALAQWAEAPELLARCHFLVTEAGAGGGPVRDWVRAQRLSNFAFFHPPADLGPGAVQKLGCRYAVDQGYDLVICGPGGGSPTAVQALLNAWQQEPADVLLGGGAQATASWLNRLQRRLLRRPLADYPVALRSYTRQFLSTVPFEVNSEDAAFDVEILLQALYVGATVRQVPLPDESPTPDRPAPALLTLLHRLLQFRGHQVGVWCSLKYRHLRPLVWRDKTDMLYTSHAMALAELQQLAPRTVLDLGCGPGFIARRCEAAGIRVTGVDLAPPLPDTMTAFHQVDLDRDPLPVDPFAYDAILLLDVVEHLHDPESFLLGLRHRAGPLPPDRLPPVVVLSTPNVAFAAVRLNLLLGRFTYAERGILDITHARLLTRAALRRLLEDCGYEIAALRPVPVPFETVLGGRTGRLLGWLSSVLARLWPSLFAFQFLVRCRPRPSVAQLLAANAPCPLPGPAGGE